jgi:hypothetical protein
MADVLPLRVAGLRHGRFYQPNGCTPMDGQVRFDGVLRQGRRRVVSFDAPRRRPEPFDQEVEKDAHLRKPMASGQVREPTAAGARGDEHRSATAPSPRRTGSATTISPSRTIPAPSSASRKAASALSVVTRGAISTSSTPSRARNVQRFGV